MKDPLRFRNSTLVVAVLGYVYDADEPIPWEELIATYTSSAHTWKTVENVIYDLVAFGALHRIGKPPVRNRYGSTTDDTRALRPTPLGRAWLGQELLELPGHHEHEDLLEEADRIAESLTTELLEIHTLEPGTEA